MRIPPLMIVIPGLGAVWPGGNFVSGYDWRDGIGDRDRRAPRRNPAWTGVEHNDVGLDEFIAFCRAVNAEPLIAVNTGFGDAYSAAQEVEYANGSTDTIGGRWRAQNGHPEPYNVTWWCVGNEMWRPWQLGYMQLKHYTQKHNQVAEYMLKADPSIKLIGAGDLNARDRLDPKDERGWSKALLLECAERMGLISEHFCCRGQSDDIPAHVAQITSRIKEKADAHREYRKTLPNLTGHDIRIAMDEWNYWFRPYVCGELGCIYRLRDALGISAGIHEFNRNRFGTIPIEVGGNCAELKIDVAAALTKDRSALTIGVVNPLHEARSIALDIEGVELDSRGVVWTIAGTSADPLLYNQPGKEPEVTIKEKTLVAPPDVLEVPPLSASVFQLKIK